MNAATLTALDTNFYHGTIDGLVPEDDVALIIDGNGENITETIAIPFPTNIISPIAPFSYNATQVLPVTWNEVTPAHPDSIYLSATTGLQSGYEWAEPMLAGSSTNGRIPGNTFKPATKNLYFDLVLQNAVTLYGVNIESGSSFTTSIRIACGYFSTI